MPKRIETLIASLSACGSIMLAPIGMYVNARLAKAGHDDLITFTDIGRRWKLVCVRTYKMRVKSAEFTFWSKFFFGEQVDWPWFADKWTALCVNEGLGKDAFSNDEVLCIALRPYVKGEYEEEMAEKQRIESKRKFMESIPIQVKMGKFEHPDVKN